MRSAPQQLSHSRELKGGLIRGGSPSGGALRCAALPFASLKQNEPAVLRPNCTEPRRYIGATLRVILGKTRRERPAGDARGIEE